MDKGFTTSKIKTRYNRTAPARTKRQHIAALAIGLGFTTFALPSRAESCRDYFDRNNLRYEEISNSRRMFISWDGSELTNCNDHGGSSFACAGKSFTGGADQVYDNNGTAWGIDWNRVSDTYECEQGSDGLYTTTNDETYTGIVRSANINTKKLVRYLTTYRVIRPAF